jgi:hypothetical protein
METVEGLKEKTYIVDNNTLLKVENLILRRSGLELLC